MGGLKAGPRGASPISSIRPCGLDALLRRSTNVAFVLLLGSYCEHSPICRRGGQSLRLMCCMASTKGALVAGGTNRGRRKVRTARSLWQLNRFCRVPGCEVQRDLKFRIVGSCVNCRDLNCFTHIDDRISAQTISAQTQAISAQTWKRTMKMDVRTVPRIVSTQRRRLN
jgi:hypothetical protein